jgi:hypothetical protein
MQPGSRLVAIVSATAALVWGLAGPEATQSAAAVPPPPSASAFVAITPTRLVDTRSGLGAPQHPLVADSAVDLQITGASVPAAATAVMVNVTATRSQGTGWLQVFPTGRATAGSSSTLNLDVAGQTIPNASFAPLGDGGRLTVYATFTTDVLVDVFGYFVPVQESAAGRLIPLTPTRILDTRAALGWTPPAPSPITPAPQPGPAAPAPTAPGTTVPAPTPGVPANPGDTKNCSDFATYAQAKSWFDTYFPYYGDVAKLDQDGDGIPCEGLSGAPNFLSGGAAPLAGVPSGTVISLQVTGRGGVPSSGVSAVVMNVTAADPAGDGYVQVAPTPVNIGASSNLNTAAGHTIANLVVVPVGSGGRVDLYTDVSVELLADVVGYFTDGTAQPSSAGLFVPISPDRQLDTRSASSSPLSAGATVTVAVQDLAPGAAAIAGNLTATAAAGGGWVQLAAAPVSVGASSNLNTAYDGQTIANAVVSPVATGQLQAYTYLPAHLLLDVTGWFTGA